MYIKLLMIKKEPVESVLREICAREKVPFVSTVPPCDFGKTPKRQGFKKIVDDYAALHCSQRFEIVNGGRGRIMWVTTYRIEDANSSVEVDFREFEKKDDLPEDWEDVPVVIRAEGARHSLNQSYTSELFNTLKEYRNEAIVQQYRTAAPEAGWWEVGVQDRARGLYDALELVAENAAHVMVTAQPLVHAAFSLNEGDEDWQRTGGLASGSIERLNDDEQAALVRAVALVIKASPEPETFAAEPWKLAPWAVQEWDSAICRGLIQ